MPTNDELEVADSLMPIATMLIVLPSAPGISALIAIIFHLVIQLHAERRSRVDVGYIGRAALNDPYESGAMTILKTGDDRAKKKDVYAV